MTFNLGKMQMRSSAELFSRRELCAAKHSPAAQPDGATSTASRKRRLQNPHSKPCLHLDPDVFFQIVSYPRVSSLRNGSYNLSQPVSCQRHLHDWYGVSVTSTANLFWADLFARRRSISK